MMISKKTDSSDFLIHLVGKNDSVNSMMEILSSGVVEAKSVFGYQRDLHNTKASCFSEIPPGFLKRLVDRRSTHGIAFKKEFMIKSGAQRVWYIDKDTDLEQQIVNLSIGRNDGNSAPLRKIFPFIDVVGCHGTKRYEFSWEREWRILGDLVFEPEDVAFLIIPNSYHEAAKAFFKEARIENLGPSYTCPFYDPLTDTYTN